MKVLANGRPFEVADQTTVADFVRSRGLDPRFVVVERNGEALGRAAYASTVLADGDRLELVRAVAGGAAVPSARDGAWRRARLAAARLYLCCDRRAGQRQGLPLAAFADAVLAGGVDVVQLRDKDGSPQELRAAAAVLRDAALRHGALFVVNDDPALAAELDADGVHVGQDDASPAAARAAVGTERLVGRSTHAVDEVDRALGEGVDYLGVGPVHPTPTKQGRAGVGLEPVRHAAAVAGDLPFFVTGGMAPGTVGPVLAAGARGVVVVRALTEADDPAAAARALAERLRARGRPEAP